MKHPAKGRADQKQNENENETKTTVITLMTGNKVDRVITGNKVDRETGPEVANRRGRVRGVDEQT